MEKKHVILASLTCMPRFGGVLYTKLTKRCNEIGMNFDEFYFCKESIMRNDFKFFGKNFINFFLSKRNEIYFNVKNELMLMANDLDVSFISRDDSSYPQKLLKSLAEYSPPILYTYGNLSLLDNKSSAIIGSRTPLDISKQICKGVSLEASKDDKVIVSGYAKGIDYQAHYSALCDSGKTIFVIPSPITKFNNLIIRDLEAKGVDYSEIKDNYLIISEFLRNSRINYKSMPIIRNRCIAGLSDDITVIEAGYPSGTMNTAKSGLDLSIKVKVVDFSYLSMKNPSGNSILIDKDCVRINPLKYLNKY